MPAASTGVCLDCKKAPRTGKGRCTPCRRAWVNSRRACGAWKDSPAKPKAAPKDPPPYDWVVVERVVSGRKANRALSRRERFEIVRLILRVEPEFPARHAAVQAVGWSTAERWFRLFKAHAEKYVDRGGLRLDWPEEFSSEQLRI